MTRQNALDFLLQISSELMEGSSRGNVAIGNDVLRARFALMGDQERETDYSEAAAALGRISTPKKAEAVRRNASMPPKPGKRPRGRPRKIDSND
jgi:hypothetical protein